VKQTFGALLAHIAGRRAGNVGIFAPRDTFFPPPRNVRQNDVITLTAVSGKYRYRVVFTGVLIRYDGAGSEPE